MSNKLRSQLPTRTFTKQYKDYKRYKKHLQKDFNEKCGYCDDHDRYMGGIGSYQIDHFAPKKFSTLVNQYQNLVYACPFCNNAKSDKWASNEEDKSVVNDEGFIDPCSEQYESHLDRSEKGKIVPLTNLGKYMHANLDLHLKRHETIWKLHNIYVEISTIKKLLSEGVQISEALKTKLGQLNADFVEYDERLRNST